MQSAGGLSGGTTDVFNFHGNPSLAYKGLEMEPITKTWWRDLKALMSIIKAGGAPAAIAAAASNLPENDRFRDIITKMMVNMLFGKMHHPPLSYRGQMFQYRHADGGYNNYLFPELGKAGLPYARTVPGVRPSHGAKPDPGDLFDLLLAREDEDDITESNLGLSSMLLYHADLIIHDIFRTNNKDKNISDTSSYLDLSPLYGQDREHQVMVRQMKLGLLKPDSFAEERLLAQPPGVCVYIIMYNRFHNYVAEQLLQINENGRFTLIEDRPEGWLPEQKILDKISSGNLKEKELGEALDKVWIEQAKAKQDEDLFQTARIITCGLYINIAIHDYLRCLMRKHAENTNWTLDPRLEMSFGKKDLVERGIGNQVTVEFNVLYRFHSPLSKRDANWTKHFIQEILTKKGYGRDSKKIEPQQFDNGDIPIGLMRVVLSELNAASGTPTEKAAKAYTPESLYFEKDKKVEGESWFWEPKRDPDTHKFYDWDLLNEIIKVIQDPICHFGANNEPKFFRSIEILGILQSRKWEQTTLNEFRQFFGLPKHQTFNDINSDRTIAKKLETLYEHPDMVELYPGLFCEGDGRNLDPGSSCPGGKGTALWSGVFCDAVTLVRSDRFYTLDWNTDTLTTWGMNEVMPDRQIMKGSVMSRLFQRAFPGYLKPDSIHLWQPFYTPAMNIVVAHDQGLLQELQDPNELLIKGAPETFEQIFDTTARHDILITDFKKYKVLSEIDRSDLKKKQKSLEDAFNEQKWYKTILQSREPDVDTLFNMLRFKRLRDVIKLEPFTKSARPPLTGVADFETIERQFLSDKMKQFFKNPGYSDKAAIPEGPLRNVLSNGTLLSEGLAVVQGMITPDVLQMFQKYFLDMADTIRLREQVELQVYQRWYYDLEEKDEKKKWKQEDTRRQVEQIDIIKDYAVPVIGRFVSDFLGFGHKVRTSPGKEQKKRVYTENDIYDLFNDCQDYLTYDADPTRAFRRRKTFQKSITVLRELTEEGVKDAQEGYLECLFKRQRSYHKTKDDSDSVIALRKFSVEVARKLSDRKVLKPHYSKNPDGSDKADESGSQTEMAAAVMLAAALDSVHKSVVMFARVMQRLLRADPTKADPKQEERTLWKEVQAIALRTDATAFPELSRYVLEAQRTTFDIPLVRQFKAPTPGDGDWVIDWTADPVTPKPASSVTSATNGKIVNGNGKSNGFVYVGPEKPMKDGDLFLLEIRKASVAQHGEEIKPKRNFPVTVAKPGEPDPLPEYLIYGQENDEKFGSKNLTILAVTALVKYAATLDHLREAHDTMGLIKEVETPVMHRGVEDEYRHRFMTVRWDEVVPFPTTWCLRFDKIQKVKEIVDGKPVYDDAVDPVPGTDVIGIAPPPANPYGPFKIEEHTGADPKSEVEDKLKKLGSEGQ